MFCAEDQVDVEIGEGLWHFLFWLDFGLCRVPSGRPLIAPHTPTVGRGYYLVGPLGPGGLGGDRNCGGRTH